MTNVGAWVVAGGTVVTPSWTGRADVLVRDEKIIAVASDLSDLVDGSERRLDAAGKYVIPGGIDVHTHMEMPFMSTRASDTFFSGTRAAALGGTTTIVDFAMQPKEGTLQEGLEEWMQRAGPQAVIDYGFHIIVRRSDQATLDEIPKMVSQGVTSFKVFMAYPNEFYLDDGGILKVMQTVAASGEQAMVLVHAENGPAIEVLMQQAIDAGLRDPIEHARTRPAALEAEATGRAIALATLAGCKLHVVHVSNADAASRIARAATGGADVTGETCPQYLYLSDEDLAQGGIEGAQVVCTPPLRSPAEVQELWTALCRGDLMCVATDHCPFCRADKAHGLEQGFQHIPNGVPGVEHRIVLLYQAVVTGQITLKDWVRLTAAAPAERFGLAPRKGTLAPGADADLVVFDPNVTWTLSVESQEMNVDYCIYEGKEVVGKVDAVLSRGNLLVEAGEFVGTSGTGSFLGRPVVS